MNGVDDVTLAVLNTLNKSHRLRCCEMDLMFDLDFDTDVVTLSGPTSKHHTVRYDEIHLCDFVNALGRPVTQELVLAALCDTYNRPEQYPWVEKTWDKS
jgi:hypothetical protein